MLAEQDQQYQEISEVIETTAKEAKNKTFWKDLDKLYGGIDILYSNSDFGNKHYDDKPLIREGWKEKIKKIESVFYKLADHVDVYDLCQYSNRDFGQLLTPKNAANGWKFSPYQSSEACDEENYCKKCRFVT